MIKPDHELSIKRQAELLNISRGSACFVPRAAPEADQRLMRRIDKLHLEHPFTGARMLRDMLQRAGFDVGRKHVGTLMIKVGIQAQYRKPNTSKKPRGTRCIPTCCEARR